MLQLFVCIIILTFSLAIYGLIGKAICMKYRWNLVMPEMVCVGFFFYFALFQVIAEVLIFTKQKLHVLGNVWMVILGLLLLMSVSVIVKEQKKNRMLPTGPATVKKIRPGKSVWLLLALMFAAIVCECLTAVLMQRNIGWDFAYYIGNMTTSVATDTMYLYDGSSGVLRETMELRYALSSFYMNTAWMSQITGISALLIQKYVMGVLCVLLTNAIVYSFAMEVFRRDIKKSAILVTITIVLTIFWDVYDTSAQFLMLRGYEAKAYCANIVLPMALYLLYRLWKKETDVCSWAELFLVAFASVAISMSAIMIVPVMIGIMLLAHLLVERRFDLLFIRRGCYCLMPNVCYLLVYLLYTIDWLVVEV